jgi:hypothetical protein
MHHSRAVPFRCFPDRLALACAREPNPKLRCHAMWVLKEELREGGAREALESADTLGNVCLVNPLRAALPWKHARDIEDRKSKEEN